MSQPGSPEAGAGDGSSCVAVQCMPPGGRYCGTIGDGCGRQMDCGACPADQTCEAGLCVGGPGCVALTCQLTPAKYCGTVGNGCGRALDCGGCDATQVCNSGLCVPAGGCVPLTCNVPSGRYCGVIGDGCGGMLDCSTCPAGAICGGGGIAGVCGGAAGCVTVACTQPGGGRYCGMIGNGCGGAQDCGACPAGAVCGGGGVPGVCPGTTTTVCQGLECRVPTCTGTATTSLSGTVRDPAGRVPLYNAVVYVPNAALDAIPEGVSCDRCSSQLSGKPIATALTDTSGRFTLTGVPAGANVPIVIQLGKWRREATIANVTACVDNPIADANVTRLPRTKAEGHIPKIALTTGSADAIECFLRKIGIADSEFTTDAGTGRVNLFVGGEPTVGGGGQGTDRFSPALGGTAFPFAASALWADPTKLLGYDILVMSCEGGQYAPTKLPYIGNIKRYADAGGRLFNGHLHFYWLRNGPAPWPSTATYVGPNSDLMSPIGGTIITSFPKGAALADWLVNVGGSTVRGQIDLYGAQYSVGPVTPPTQAWITVNQTPTPTEYLTFNTPVEVAPDAQCGRVVETDIHVKAVPSNQNGKDTSAPGAAKAFPTACQSTMSSPQEKALEFLLFDLSSCIQPDSVPPVPPVVPPPGVPAGPPTVVSRPPPVPPPPPPPPPPVIP